MANAFQSGRSQCLHTRPAYIQHLLGYVDQKALKPLKLVMNAGNGGAGIVIDQIEKHLPFEMIKVHHNPDGTFPHGVPNPLLEENRAPTIEALKKSGADMGIAWDGDFDRCFFFDENGALVGIDVQHASQKADIQNLSLLHLPLRELDAA